MAREATTFYKRLADELSRKLEAGQTIRVGFAAACHSLYSDLLSFAFVEVDPLATTQSVSSTLNLPLQRDMFPLTCNVSVFFVFPFLNCNHSYACLSLKNIYNGRLHGYKTCQINSEQTQEEVSNWINLKISRSQPILIALVAQSR